MDDFNLDPENIPNFHLPENTLEQLYNFSGNGDAGKGFLLIFAGQDGTPMIYSKTESQLIEMGLRKAMEEYLKQATQTDIDTSFGQVDE
tara:strand:+ start:515 stop:781 length:267 start_codon:yes stop_codon:yes gene_type:complete